MGTQEGLNAKTTFWRHSDKSGFHFQGYGGVSECFTIEGFVVVLKRYQTSCLSTKQVVISSCVEKNREFTHETTKRNLDQTWTVCFSALLRSAC